MGILGIIAGLLPVAIQIFGYFVNNSKLDEERKKAFFEWVKDAGKDLSSVKLTQYGDKQLAWLKDPANPWKEAP